MEAPAAPAGLAERERGVNCPEAETILAPASEAFREEAVVVEVETEVLAARREAS